MRKYELVFILRPQQPEGALDARMERVAQIVGDHEGQITGHDHWGVRQLAYEIDDETRGDYMLVKFNSRGTVVTDLDRYFRQDDLCIRHLVVRDEEWAERNRAAQAKRRAARAEAQAEDTDE